MAGTTGRGVQLFHLRLGSGGWVQTEFGGYTSADSTVSLEKECGLAMATTLRGHGQVHECKRSPLGTNCGVQKIFMRGFYITCNLLVTIGGILLVPKVVPLLGQWPTHIWWPPNFC